MLERVAGDGGEWIVSKSASSFFAHIEIFPYVCFRKLKDDDTEIDTSSCVRLPACGEGAAYG